MGKGRGGHGGHTLQDLRAGKRAAAEQRNSAYAELTTKQKIDGLPNGAARQRAKLTVLLFSEKEAAKALKAEKAAEKAAAKSEKK